MKLQRTFFFFFFFFAVTGFSQSNANIQLWTGANVKLDLGKKWSLSYSPELRFTDTMRTLNSVINELGVKYKLNKSISLLAEYRYTYRPTKNDVNRFCLGASYDWSKKDFPLSFSYRIKFQYSRNRNSGSSESYLRNKITLDYNLSKLVDPSVSYELFFLFGKNEFRNSRYSFGLEWRLTKKLSLNTYYMYQREIYVKNPSSDHIFGIGLNYKMKIKDKKTNASIE